MQASRSMPRGSAAAMGRPRSGVTNPTLTYAKHLIQPGLPEHAARVGGRHGRPECRGLVRVHALRVQVDGAEARVEARALGAAVGDVGPLGPAR